MRHPPRGDGTFYVCFAGRRKPHPAASVRRRGIVPAPPPSPKACRCMACAAYGWWRLHYLFVMIVAPAGLVDLDYVRAVADCADDLHPDVPAAGVGSHAGGADARRATARPFDFAVERATFATGRNLPDPARRRRFLWLGFPGGFGCEARAEWWSRRDSNPLPTGCKPVALPIELRPRAYVTLPARGRTVNAAIGRPGHADEVLIPRSRSASSRALCSEW